MPFSSSSKKMFLSLIYILCVLACREYDEYKEEVVEHGAFRCVQSIGVKKKSHSSPAFYNLGRKVYVKGNLFSPDEYKDFNNDIASCDLSPNKDVAVMLFYNVNYDRGGVYILKMENGQPMLIKVAPHDSRDEGCWTNDGRWLLFQNYFVNVETGEKKEIKQLPDKPSDLYNLVAISPDMKTVVMNGKREGDTFSLKVIDTETGEIKEPKFKLPEYNWLLDHQHPVTNSDGANHLWISNQFKWEKDKNGKDFFVYPKSESEMKGEKKKEKLD